MFVWVLAGGRIFVTSIVDSAIGALMPEVALKKACMIEYIKYNFHRLLV
jgi:hypothetical protein